MYGPSRRLEAAAVRRRITLVRPQQHDRKVSPCARAPPSLRVNVHRVLSRSRRHNILPRIILPPVSVRLLPHLEALCVRAMDQRSPNFRTFRVFWVQFRLDASSTGENEPCIRSRLQPIALDIRVLFRALEPPIEDQISFGSIDFDEAAFREKNTNLC